MARKELPRNPKVNEKKAQQEKVEINKARHTSHHDLSGPRGKNPGDGKMLKNGKR